MGPEDPGRVSELEEENRRLRAELAELRQHREQARIAARTAVGWGGRLLLGRSLRSSFRAWLEAKSLRDPLPVDETAGVLAAIVRRVVRVGLVGFLLAWVPAIFLCWQSLLMRQQSLLMREQNEAIRTQIEQQQRQIAEQAADTLIVRRAQLLATIYDCEANQEEDCKPRANRRARQEAVVAFCVIEHKREAVPGLSGSNLSLLDLSETDFRAADLRRANLIGATLNGSDLSDAKLHGAALGGAHLDRADLGGAQLAGAQLIEARLTEANLSDADLTQADLTRASLGKADLSRVKLNLAVLLGANLSGARLRGVDLSGADLGGADFSAADIRGADLAEALNLTQEQLDSARGDGTTRLPPGLRRPGGWAASNSG